jgi:hypothetical protein
MCAAPAHTHSHSPVREAVSVFRIGVDLEGGSTHADYPCLLIARAAHATACPCPIKVPGEAATPDLRVSPPVGGTSRVDHPIAEARLFVEGPRATPLSYPR